MGRRNAWFPFTSGEFQATLGVYGFLITAANLAAVNSFVLLMGTGIYLAFAYLAGLLVHLTRTSRRFTFHVDGGVEGVGYIPFFSKARRCLFLVHVEDDAPCEELLATYRRLLRRGVSIRRTIFVRPEASPRWHSWIAEFGEHELLSQRVVGPADAALTRMSFAVVDDGTVLIAVPGFDAIDDERYTERMVLRHLIVIDDPDVARTFLSLHEQSWERARPLEDPGVLLRR